MRDIQDHIDGGSTLLFHIDKHHLKIDQHGPSHRYLNGICKLECIQLPFKEPHSKQKFIQTGGDLKSDQYALISPTLNRFLAGKLGLRSIGATQAEKNVEQKRENSLLSLDDWNSIFMLIPTFWEDIIEMSATYPFVKAT